MWSDYVDQGGSYTFRAVTNKSITDLKFPYFPLQPVVKAEVIASRKTFKCNFFSFYRAFAGQLPFKDAGGRGPVAPVYRHIVTDCYIGNHSNQF